MGSSFKRSLHIFAATPFGTFCVIAGSALAAGYVAKEVSQSDGPHVVFAAIAGAALVPLVNGLVYNRLETYIYHSNPVIAQKAIRNYGLTVLPLIVAASVCLGAIVGNASKPKSPPQNMAVAIALRTLNL